MLTTTSLYIQSFSSCNDLYIADRRQRYEILEND